MATIRPFERVDLPAVTALLRDHLEGWDDAPESLEATLLDHPWADPETPSLVATDDEDLLIGFVGAQPRRLRLDDRELRGVCCSHLVVDPASRGGAAGALLLGRLLKGPQELTWSDTAVDVVARMWATFGGHVDHGRAHDWMLVLRPLAWSRGVALGAAARRLARAGGRVGAVAAQRFDRGTLPVAAVPIRAAGRGAAGADPGAGPAVTGENAGPAAIAELTAGALRGVALRVDYDERALAYTLGLAEARWGALVTRIVRRNGRPVGWYAYLPRREISRVLHVAAAPRDAEQVLGELVRHAHGRGSAALAGRGEPHLDAPLRARLAVLGFARRPIVHSRDEELNAVLATDASLLTRLDGEWYVP